MDYISHYESPLGPILLAAEETGLTGVWFEGQKYFARGLAPGSREREIPVLTASKVWLDAYFAGKAPEMGLPLHFAGSPFQTAVWQCLCRVPYGQTVTYGQLAARLAKELGLPRMSAQAVGGAVGHNPISVIVPCHRVVGSYGSLTGYAGGMERKIALLKLEGGYRDSFYVPRRAARKKALWQS